MLWDSDKNHPAPNDGTGLAGERFEVVASGFWFWTFGFWGLIPDGHTAVTAADATVRQDGWAVFAVGAECVLERLADLGRDVGEMDTPEG